MNGIGEPRVTELRRVAHSNQICLPPDGGRAKIDAACLGTGKRASQKEMARYQTGLHCLMSRCESHAIGHTIGVFE